MVPSGQDGPAACYDCWVLQVLAGVRIVFSRVIPLDQPPQQHELWKRAEQFGATCSEKADASVTHVISKALGTQKVQASQLVNVKSCLEPVRSELEPGLLQPQAGDSRLVASRRPYGSLRLCLALTCKGGECGVGALGSRDREICRHPSMVRGCCS